MGVSYTDIIERMRWSGKLKNDSAVARVLGVTPQALSNYKKRGEMPSDLVIRFAGIYGLSLDWLIAGEGEMHKPGARGQEVERRGYMFVAEDTTGYGRDEREGAQKMAEFASLTPDEIIYVGKLLKLLRGPNKSTAAAIKYSVDAFLKAAEEPSEEQSEREIEVKN
jgi:hypothetical protein